MLFSKNAFLDQSSTIVVSKAVKRLWLVAGGWNYLALITTLAQVPTYRPLSHIGIVSIIICALLTSLSLLYIFMDVMWSWFSRIHGCKMFSWLCLCRINRIQCKLGSHSLPKQVEVRQVFLKSVMRLAKFNNTAKRYFSDPRLQPSAWHLLRRRNVSPRRQFHLLG